MAEASSFDRRALLDDQRMWRLLLARLHPDIGGDHELFLFACALRDGTYGEGRLGRKQTRNNGERRAERPAEHFPRAWRDAMGCWALRNREALKNCQA